MPGSSSGKASKPRGPSGIPLTETSIREAGSSPETSALTKDSQAPGAIGTTTSTGVLSPIGRGAADNSARTMFPLVESPLSRGASPPETSCSERLRPEALSRTGRSMPNGAAMVSSAQGRNSITLSLANRPAKETLTVPPARVRFWGRRRVRSSMPLPVPRVPRPALRSVRSPERAIHSTTGPPSPLSSKTTVRAWQEVSASGDTESTGISTASDAVMIRNPEFVDAFVAPPCRSILRGEGVGGRVGGGTVACSDDWALNGRTAELISRTVRRRRFTITSSRRTEAERQRLCARSTHFPALSF